MSTRITTWNVNGLRALLSKGLLDKVLALEPDLLLLQEIKTRPDQIDPVDHQQWQHYHQHWHPADRPGYSGVATFIKSESFQANVGIGNPEFDQEGRIIIAHGLEFSVINAYFPSGQRDRGRVNYKLKFYAQLLELCEQLQRQGVQIIIGGDFNTAHQEIDLRYPEQNKNTSGFLAEEREWVDRYLDKDFVDAYRHLYPTRVQYTWWTYRLNARARNIGWRLDYFLVSKSLIGRVQDVVIHEDIEGSDHCPVSIIIE